MGCYLFNLVFRKSLECALLFLLLHLLSTFVSNNFLTLTNVLSK